MHVYSTVETDTAQQHTLYYHNKYNAPKWYAKLLLCFERHVRSSFTSADCVTAAAVVAAVLGCFLNSIFCALDLVRIGGSQFYVANIQYILSYIILLYITFYGVVNR